MSYETTTPAPSATPSPPVTETVKEVASRSAGEAKQLTGEALDGARQLVRSGRDEVRGQLQQQTTRAAEAARTASSQLLALANGDTQSAERMQSFARDMGNRLQQLADRLDREGLDGIARQTSDFARRRPALFLGGMAVAGFLAGRYAKVLMERNDEPSQSFGSGGQSGNGWRRPEPLMGRPAVIDPTLPVDPVTGAPMITEPTGYEASSAPNTSFGTNPSRAGFDAPPPPGADR